MKFTREWTVACLAVAMCLPVAMVSAQSSSSSSQASSSKESSSLKHSDKKFAEDAAKGGKAEVQIGQLVAQKAQGQQVKQFGDKLVRDHQQANQKLEKIMQDKGLSQPTELKRDAQKEIDRLSQMSGEQFDREFLQFAVDDHQKDIKKFEKEASDAEDPALRSFASETLPTLREHLRIAQTLRDNPNASIPELKESAGAESGKDKSMQQKSQDQPKQQNQ